MRDFRFFIFTPAGYDDPSLAIAASRAEAVGIFNAECHTDSQPVIEALERLAGFARNSYGLKLGRSVSDDLLDHVLDDYSNGLHWIIIDAESVRLRGRSNRGRRHGSPIPHPPQQRELELHDRKPGCVFQNRRAGVLHVRVAVRAPRIGSAETARHRQ